VQTATPRTSIGGGNGLPLPSPPATKPPTKSGSRDAFLDLDSILSKQDGMKKSIEIGKNECEKKAHGLFIKNI
jgi:hypothetical protein